MSGDSGTCTATSENGHRIGTHLTHGEPVAIRKGLRRERTGWSGAEAGSPAPATCGAPCASPAPRQNATAPLVFASQLTSRIPGNVRPLVSSLFGEVSL